MCNYDDENYHDSVHVVPNSIITVNAEQGRIFEEVVEQTSKSFEAHKEAKI